MPVAHSAGSGNATRRADNKGKLSPLGEGARAYLEGSGNVAEGFAKGAYELGQSAWNTITDLPGTVNGIRESVGE